MKDWKAFPEMPTFYMKISYKSCYILWSLCTARSPLYSHISSTIQGLSTIRSFNEQEKFSDKFHYYLNEHTKAWYLYIVINRWFGARIDLISILFLTFVVMTAIPLADSKWCLTTLTMNMFLCIPIKVHHIFCRPWSKPCRAFSCLYHHTDRHVSVLCSHQCWSGKFGKEMTWPVTLVNGLPSIVSISRKSYGLWKIRKWRRTWNNSEGQSSS